MTSVGVIAKLSIAVWLAVWSQLAFAGEPVRIGIMDQQLVLERTKAGKLALEDMKSYSKARERIIKADEQELKELEQELQDETRKLGEAAKQEKEAQVRSKVEAYQRRVQDFNREIQQKQQEMASEFSKKIADAAQAVAQKEGYLAILDKGNEEVARIVIYYQPGLDVTDLVVKEFDRQNK